MVSSQSVQPRELGNRLAKHAKQFQQALKRRVCRAPAGAALSAGVGPHSGRPAFTMAACAATRAAAAPAAAVRAPSRMSSISPAAVPTVGKPVASRRSRQVAKVLAVAEAQRTMDRSFEAALKYRCVGMEPGARLWSCMAALAPAAAAL